MLRSTRSSGVKNLGSFHSKLHAGNRGQHARSIVWSIFHHVGVVSYFIGDNLTELVLRVIMTLKLPEVPVQFSL